MLRHHLDFDIKIVNVRLYTCRRLKGLRKLGWIFNRICSSKQWLSWGSSTADLPYGRNHVQGDETWWYWDVSNTQWQRQVWHVATVYRKEIESKFKWVYIMLKRNCIWCSHTGKCQDLSGFRTWSNLNTPEYTTPLGLVRPDTIVDRRPSPRLTAFCFFVDRGRSRLTFGRPMLSPSQLNQTQS